MTTRRKMLQATGAILATTAEAAEPEESKNAAVTESEKFRQAAISGDLATVISMLDRDPALLYSRDAAGVSVYTLASLKGQTKVAEELARRGLVLDAFEAAAAGDNKRAAELAKDDPGIAHHRLPDGRTPLHIAGAAGKPGMVTFFTTRGADLSAGPESPLLPAVDHPDRAPATEMAQFLLMNASDPNAKRRDGKTALHLAATRGYDEIVTFLIHRGANPETRDAEGKLPVDVATGEAVAVLRKPAAIDRVYYGRRYTQDAHGNPMAHEENKADIPQELINQFASVAHFDFEKVKQLQKLCPSLIMTRATWDEMAIEASAHMGLVPMAQFLADLGAPVSTCTATMLGAHDLVKKLVREDPACVRERGAHDIALLAYTAIGAQRVDTAELLLDAGTDIHSRMFGQTTLHVAASKGHVELARLLLDRGADVNAIAKIRGAGVTPLAVAVQAKQTKLADLLKERGGRA